MSHQALKSSLATGFVVAVAAALVAGPLDPPAGPVTSTYKTLSEVEPRIAINAANTPGDADSLFKITVPGSYYLTGNITGVVGKHGIEIAASGVTLDLGGFDLAGVPGVGFFSGVTVSGSGLTNICVLNGSVRGWEGEAGVDMTGVFINSNCRVEGVLASGNTNIGIRTGSGGTVRNCSAFGNGTNGISVSNGAVMHCTALNNLSSGVAVGTGCLVIDCVARLNTVDGIRCANESVITGNVCTSNGNGTGNGAGIHATGSDNRIESNNCTGADRGIDVDGAGNIITRNTCSGNTTNWDVVAGNVCLVVQGVSGAAILGNTGGVAPGSTDPSANFTY